MFVSRGATARQPVYLYMVALALLLAESDPSQKDLMIRLVLSLLGDERP